jgi:cobalt/nickel transport system ATP-binding protein
VLEDVAFGPLNQGLHREEARERALWALHLVGLKGFEDRITHKLSGGEKRILSLATILSMHPEALLMDEPSTGLDPQTRAHIISIINKLPQSLVIVSHDWDFLAQTTNILYTLENGQLIKTDTGTLHQHVHFHPSGHIPHEHKNGLKG